MFKDFGLLQKFEKKTIEAAFKREVVFKGSYIGSVNFIIFQKLLVELFRFLPIRQKDG